MTVVAPVLEVRGLSKSFGGVQATRDVSLAIAPGTIHAVIGPNGAGKTTLIGQLFGDIVPDSGEIVFNGRDITQAPTYRRTGIGMARSFQITTLAQDMTAFEHVVLSLLAAEGSAFRFFAPVRQDPALAEPAGALLERCGLSERADLPVAALSHGEHRQLELALALAADPEMLLLDEPMAGLGPGEGHAFIDRLKRLKSGPAILLVEHDMGAVFELADVVTVLVDGAVAAEGSPQAIKADARVRALYLGED